MSGISFQELTRLLGGAAATFGHISAPNTVENDDSDPDYIDEEDDDDDLGSYYGRYQRTNHQWFPAITEPQEAGLNLLMSGEFGRVGQRLGSRRSNMDVARLLRDRGTKTRPSNYKEDIASVSLSTSCETYHD
jgi:WD repeat-containing protein 23